MEGHKIKHHHEDGHMWSSCECGWESKHLHWSHNLQLTESCLSGLRHQKNVKALELEERLKVR